MPDLTKDSTNDLKDVKLTLGPFPDVNIINKKTSLALEEDEIRVFYGIDTENERVIWICGISSCDFDPGCRSEERLVGLIDHAIPDISEIVNTNIQLIIPKKCNSEAEGIRNSFLKFYKFFYDSFYSEISDRLKEFNKAIEDNIETIVWGDETRLLRLKRNK